MVKPTEYRHRDDLATFAVELMRTRNRDLLTNSLVRSAGIETAQSELFENVLQVTSSENDDVVQAFASDTIR